MLVDIHNPSRAPRIIYIGEQGNDMLRIMPGATGYGKVVTPENAERLRSSGLTVKSHAPEDDPDNWAAQTMTFPSKRAIFIDGMWGIGDCLHQRAPIRELMKDNEVWLSTCHFNIYHDLVAQGLHLSFKATKLRAQAKTIERERSLFTAPPLEPGNTWRIKLWYKKEQIDLYGTILGSMMAECGVPGVQGDFSLPIPAEWLAKAEALKASWDIGGKPIMIYRPVVRRREWNGESRNPDPEAYAKLYEAARPGFFTVSIADLEPQLEWIVGGEQPADVKLHHGELDFETMAALWRIADIGFFNAGFGPVLAQAVGLSSIVVYGGRESFKTTEIAGLHLAPTLGIDPINTCDCHTERHPCDKRIDVPAALDRVREFVEKHRVRVDGPSVPPQVGSTLADTVTRSSQDVRPSASVEQSTRTPDTLIFATVFVDSEARQTLTEQWLELTAALNPGDPLLLVDSQSPLPLVSDSWKSQHRGLAYEVYNFPDNIGHLSRNGGRDGWGRAFCKGLEIALERGFRYAAHIEGDSLLRLPVASLIDQMLQAQRDCCTTAVAGMERDMPGWVETGLMIFKTEYVKKSRFIERYEWPRRMARPTPELVIAKMITPDVFMLPIKAIRGDKKQVTYQNVLSLNLDWLTHCHNDTWATDEFFKAAMPKEVMPLAGGDALRSNPTVVTTPVVEAPATNLKLNLGCGTNKLDGWRNHDADVDITKHLPWPDGAADYIFIEHCVEHVTFHQAIGFFEEALRVLHPGGVLRVVVPSIEQIAKLSDQAYWDFTKKFGGDGTLKGALSTIIHQHGHLQAWTASLMAQSLSYAGFIAVEEVRVGGSRHSDLRGVEGHGKVIGDRFNQIESMCFEGTKPGGVVYAPAAIGACREKVAVVVGGAADVFNEVMDARHLCETVGVNPEFFVINDMIAMFEGQMTAVSLHPADPKKLPAWLQARADKGFPAPRDVWAHRPQPGVTKHTEDWAGSSGLFAAKIARQLGFKKILLCGVPMTMEGGHIVRRAPWTQFKTFQRAWLTHHNDIAPYVRSFSGWTAERLGKPDAEFLVAVAQKAA